MRLKRKPAKIIDCGIGEQHREKEYRNQSIALAVKAVDAALFGRSNYGTVRYIPKYMHSSEEAAAEPAVKTTATQFSVKLKKKLEKKRQLLFYHH